MRRFLFPKVRLSPEDVTLSILSGAGLAFALVWMIYPHLGGGQAYTDLIVGALAWEDYDKDHEWRAFNLLWIGTVVFSLGLGGVFHYLRTKDLSDECLRAVRLLICVAWLPGVFWVGAVLMRPRVTPSFIIAAGALLIFVSLIVLVLSRYQERLTYEDVVDAGWSSIMVLLLSVFAALAVAVTIGQISLDAKDVFSREGSWFLVGAGLALAGLFSVANVYFSRSLATMKRRFHLSLLSLQVPIPFLLLVFMSKDYVYRGEALTMYKSQGLFTVLVGFIMLAWFMLLQRYRKLCQGNDTSRESSYVNVLSPAALFPIPVYISWSQYTSTSTFAATDDFHLGEQLLPWQQIIDFGKLPYVDFAPIHGLMSMAYGGLNELFYGHTVATFPLAMELLTAIAVGLTFLALFSYAGPLPALALAPFAGGTLDRFYLLVPAVLLFSHSKVTKHSKVWLSVWIVVCPILVLFNAAIGVAVVIGSFPVAIYMGLRAAREDTRWFGWFLASLTGVAFVALIFSPLRQMIFGFLQFMLDNTSTYTIANAIGMFQHSTHPDGLGLAANQFQWNLLRLSWMLVAIVAAVIFFRVLVAENKSQNSRHMLFVALIPITLFMIAPWALSRVEAGMLGRSGSLSCLALTFFIPLILVGVGSDHSRSVRMIFSALIVGAAVSVIPGVPNYKVWLSNPFVKQVVKLDYMFVSGSDIGLPRLGNMFADPKRVAEIQDLKEALQQHLKPGETFLDLTNHSALHFYVDMPVPVLYSSDYVAANGRSEAKIINQIEKDPPPIVLLAPDIRSDSGPVPFRSYILYRKFIDSYIPKKIGAFIFLIRPDRIDPRDDDSVETRMRVLDQVFRVRALYWIPNAWGRSWDILEGRFTRITSLQPTNVVGFVVSNDGSYIPSAIDPHIVYDLRRYHLKGDIVDYILINYECVNPSSDPPPIIEVYWATEIDSLGDKTDFRFYATGTTAIIPVGTQPRWRLAQDIRALRLNLQDHRSCTELRINDVTLLKLNEF